MEMNGNVSNWLNSKVTLNPMLAVSAANFMIRVFYLST